MPVCRKCGQEFHNSLWERIFWRNDLCPSCRVRRNEAIRLLSSRLDQFANDGYLDIREERALQEIMHQYDLTEQDLSPVMTRLNELRSRTRAENIRLLRKKFEQISSDGYIDDEELRSLHEMAASMGITLEEIDDIAIRLRRLLDLTAIHDGKLPVLDDVDIILKPREMCHLAYPVQLVEERSHTHYVGGSRGVSIRLTKHISYRVGGFHGQRITVKNLEIVDNGELYVTNQRILYAGERRTYVYPLGKLVAVNKYANGIRFQKEGEKRPKYFLIDDEFLIEEIALLVYKLIEKRTER